LGGDIGLHQPIFLILVCSSFIRVRQIRPIGVSFVMVVHRDVIQEAHAEPKHLVQQHVHAPRPGILGAQAGYISSIGGHGKEEAECFAARHHLDVMNVEGLGSHELELIAGATGQGRGQEVELEALLECQDAGHVEIRLQLHVVQENQYVVGGGSGMAAQKVSCDARFANPGHGVREVLQGVRVIRMDRDMQGGPGMGAEEGEIRAQDGLLVFLVGRTPAWDNHLERGLH